MKIVALAVGGIALLALSTSASAMPRGMGYKCQDHYARYDIQAGPKAFALGRNGACAWKARVRSIREAEMESIAGCRRQRGTDCRIVDSHRY